LEVSPRPSRQERKAYRAAENRIKESILLRDILPQHRYPQYEEDRETIRSYHRRYGVPALGLFARARRLLEGRGL
jgi:hypothetical protein